MSLSDIIKQYVPLLVENKNNWFSTRCLVCNDHEPGSSTFKGLRGNFYLNDNIIGYNCYNCDHKARYDPDKDDIFSNNMISVFESFGIPEKEYSKFLIEQFGSVKTKSNVIVKSNYEPDYITYPKHFYFLKDGDSKDKWTIIANHYLEERGIDPLSYDFMLSTGEGKFGSKWKGRIIIPYYKNRNLIYYQGRALFDSMKKKYENPSIDKSNILYNFDELETYSELPIFIVEGFFDAFLINGVALNGKNITKGQEYWLNRSKRDKIVIPDKYGDGIRIANQAIDLGWKISCPNFGYCKDINEAYTRYGKLYIISEIMKNIYEGKQAKMMVSLYCDK